MSSASNIINHPRCHCDLEAKFFLLVIGEIIKVRFHGCANIISKENLECGFFKWFSEDEDAKVTEEMKDSFSMRVERIEREIYNVFEQT